MGKQRIEFGATEVEIQVEDHTFTFRALTVKEMEGLVAQHEDDAEEVLTAAIIVEGNVDGQLEGYTAEDFGDWPAHYFRKVQRAVAELNGLGSIDGGN